MKLKKYPFENLVPCDANAPSPCENHSSYCDLWYTNGCAWWTCESYLPKDGTAAVKKHDSNQNHD